MCVSSVNFFVFYLITTFFLCFLFVIMITTHTHTHGKYLISLPYNLITSRTFVRCEAIFHLICQKKDELNFQEKWNEKKEENHVKCVIQHLLNWNSFLQTIDKFHVDGWFFSLLAQPISSGDLLWCVCVCVYGVGVCLRSYQSYSCNIFSKHKSEEEKSSACVWSCFLFCSRIFRI